MKADLNQLPRSVLAVYSFLLKVVVFRLQCARKQANTTHIYGLSAELAPVAATAAPVAGKYDVPPNAESLSHAFMGFGTRPKTHAVEHRRILQAIC